MLFGLIGCAAADPVAELGKIAQETTTPPPVQRQSIEASVAMFASGRFDAGVPLWFIVKPGIPPVALFKQVDLALGNRAKRVVETGPDQVDAQMRVWKIGQSGKAAVLAVLIDPAGSTSELAAYYPAQLDARWHPEMVNPSAQ
jgi:hypothetical protein